MESLERIQRTSAETLGAVMDRKTEGVAADEEPCVAVAA
jgi:hypothetical protein